MIYSLFKQNVEKAKNILFIGNSSLLLKISLFVFNYCDFGNDVRVHLSKLQLQQLTPQTVTFGFIDSDDETFPIQSHFLFLFRQYINRMLDKTDFYISKIYRILLLESHR